MLVRIRSKDGNFRFELKSTDDASALLAKILETSPNADQNSITVSQQPRGGETLLKSLFGRSLESLGLKHADLLFVAYHDSQSTSVGQSQSSVASPMLSAQTPPAAGSTKRPWEVAEEDPVDSYWRQRDGKISRQRNATFCRHGANGMCDYCMPLEPYDPAYQAEHSIKHLSFHTYLRQLAPQQPAQSTSVGAKATPSSSLPPLNPLNYRVRIPCPTGGHAPYPDGICSSCQPGAITLSRQTWRATDHVEIASPSIIDDFLSFWRRSGRQRFGWMLGVYKPYEEVPMGVKAVVEAIHEPPQDGDIDGLTLELPWEDQGHVLKIAAACGLQVVGMIFTDLTPDPNNKTKTLCKRHGHSFFLSSLEATFSARQQLNHPLKTKSSSTGLFSSRLVTAVLSGTPDGGIDLACYMVSEQACAMVDADMIEATVEPGTVRIKSETEGEGRYVPDAFFTYKNEYGIQVKETAKPCFPVEYLLVNVTHGFPTTPTPMFRTAAPFAIENRPLTDPQDATQVYKAFYNLAAPKLVQGHANEHNDTEIRRSVAYFVSDWHLIAFLPSLGVLSEEDIKLIARIATQPNLEEPALLDSLIQSDGWRTLMAIAGESEPPPRPANPPPSGDPPTGSSEIPPDVYSQFGAGSNDGAATIPCPHCTFENPTGRSDCEVCGLPLS